MTERELKNINVFIQRLQTFFIFVTFFTYFNVFYFFLERFYIYGVGPWAEPVRGTREFCLSPAVSYRSGEGGAKSADQSPNFER